MLPATPTALRPVAPVRRTFSLLAASTVLVTLTAIGCSDDGPTPTGDVHPGQLVYENRLEDANTFSCSSCHATEEPSADGLRRPGHQIGDAFRRPTFKNGQVTDLREAVNTCVVEWMRGEPLAETDPRWIDLSAWLEEIAPPDEAPTVDIQIISPPADLSGGTVEDGRMLFNMSCNICHGMNATGTERAPALPNQGLTRDLIATRVRLSGDPQSPIYPGLQGGVMPFWGADRLTDGELKHLLAYVESLQTVVPPGMGDGGPDDGGPTDGGPDPDGGPTDGGGTDTAPPSEACPPKDMQPKCPQTHPRVGQVTQLETNAHNVSGSVCVVDNCTLLFRNFSYNGGGIDVRVYGASCEGESCDFNNGFAMTDDILGDVYDGTGTLVAKLPEGRTLDDVDGVSIWCVAARVSFGDGQFE